MAVARQSSVLALSAALVVAAVCASLVFGAVHVPLGDVIDALLGRGEAGPLTEIVLQLRLPRTVDALVVGAALGVAGALLQGALANPLASPDIIGVTGGASFGAMLAILAFPSLIALMPLSALIFGTFAVAMVFLVAWGGRAPSIARLILAGIAISALFGAATSGLMVAFSDRVSSAVFWLAGGMPSDGWESMSVCWPYFAVGFAIAIFLPRSLDRLSLGDDVAESLGVHPGRIRLIATGAAALLAAAAAAIAGLLVFLGLLVPHLARLAGGTSSHRYVLVASALIGAAILTVGDTLARVIAAPVELPVGPLMVLLGVPVFLWLLRREV